MGIPFEKVEADARRLSEEERARLAASLLESLQSATADLKKAWGNEIEQRVVAYDRGQKPSFAAEDVFAEARPN